MKLYIVSFPQARPAPGGMVTPATYDTTIILSYKKRFVNAIFLPENAGDNYLGYENDYEGL